MSTINDFIYNLLPGLYADPVTVASGIIYLYADYKLPVKEIKRQTLIALDEQVDRNKKIAEAKILDNTGKRVELRVKLYNESGLTDKAFPINFHERIVAVISKHYPGCFVKTRIENKKGAVR